MKLLFNYLTHSVKEGDQIDNSKSTASTSNGISKKANKGIGNKIKKSETLKSGTDIRLSKFFNSFRSSQSPVVNGNSGSSAKTKKQCDSQMNGTPIKKRSKTSSIKSKSNSKNSPSPKKSTSNQNGKNPTSLTTSASSSAKKRAIEQALNKGKPSTKIKRKLNLEESKLKKDKKRHKVEGKLIVDAASDGVSVKRKKKPPPDAPKRKRGRPRLISLSSDDESGNSRPRRRASQTYIIKYQLARNPLKAEEDDLRQALLASLEQCGPQKSTSSKKQKQLLDELLLQDQTSNSSINSKTTKHNQRENHHRKQPRKQHPKHPPSSKQTHSKTSSLSIAHSFVPVTPATVATSTPPTYGEEYLEKYRPDTEDFLTFICFRVTAPDVPYKSKPAIDTNNESSDVLHTASFKSNSSNGYTANNGVDSNDTDSSSITGSLNIKIEPNSTIHNSKQPNCSSITPSILNDNHNLRRSDSPHKLGGETPSLNSNQLDSPVSNRRRPPTRQSPRLALNIQQQKISETASDGNLNRTLASGYTALDQNPINDYEEDLKKASMALDDMAHEITNGNSVDTMTPPITTRQQNGKSSFHNNNLLLLTADAINRQSQSSHDSSPEPSQQQPSPDATTLPFKSNKHLVKELMTREFAGTFADEEIIFESISNHKL